MEPRFISVKGEEAPVLTWTDEDGAIQIARPRRMSECVRCGTMEPYMGANQFICLSCNQRELYGMEGEN